jgi:hypothetical protein
LPYPLPEQLFELMLHLLDLKLQFTQFLGLIANLAMGRGKIVRKWAFYRMCHTISYGKTSRFVCAISK